MSIHQVFYVSNANEHLTGDQDIQKIVAAAREYNPKNQITGVLMFRGGIFLQLIEGAQDKVEALFKKINEDPRHSNVILLFERETDERMFPDWSMGYKKLGDLDIRFVNEILSWSRLVSAAKTIDRDLILYFLTRFKERLTSEEESAQST